MYYHQCCLNIIFQLEFFTTFNISDETYLSQTAFQREGAADDGTVAEH